ncbi:diaminopimelate decarboxylase family protein [Terrisporobacter vanillatitrophus]|uniref:diaminopimelate decarboxylase family protein n=1 Tax=Terrisporobacter vanillatitrophus TaxID=3058402 RepID=UPI003367EB90
MIDNNILRQLMSKVNKSFYVYDEEEILKSINILKDKFKEFEILYSVKTNPNKNILNLMSKNNIGADAASAKEVGISNVANINKNNIIYSAPGKRRKDIEESIDKCIITADSYNELSLLNEIGKDSNTHLEVGLRINADYNIFGGDSISSKYGVDEETLLENKNFIDSLSNIEIVGIHVHLQSQILDYEIIYNYYEYVLKLALFCKKEMNFNLKFINFGGGLGISYGDSYKNLDIDKLSTMSNKLIEKYKEKLNTRFIIESGRFLVCKSGAYVTPIIDIKESRGKKYLIVQNGYNGFFKPTISELIVSYTNKKDNLKMMEPLFTSYDSYTTSLIKRENEIENHKEIVTIGGNLCTSVDILAKDILLTKAEINDLIFINNAGSYAYSLTPLLFSSQEKPVEIYFRSKDDYLID